MKTTRLERQHAELADEKTLEALDEAETQIRRGEVVSLEEACKNARARYKEGQKIQQGGRPPAESRLLS